MNHRLTTNLLFSVHPLPPQLRHVPSLQQLHLNLSGNVCGDAGAMLTLFGLFSNSTHTAIPKPSLSHRHPKFFFSLLNSF